MNSILAVLRQDMLTRASYRFQVLTSFLGLFALLIPFYFVTDALNPMMEGSIEGQGGHYFTFALVGLIVMRFCIEIVQSLPRAFGLALRTGTLEAIFSTPVPLATLVAGMVAFPLLWASAEAGVLLVTGTLLGARIVFSQLLAGLLILALILLTYLSFSIVAVALILVFRTAGPLITGVLLATNLLGGIYYPTHVIPSWIQLGSAALPMTYGLRALRQLVLEGASLHAVSPDLLVLCLFLLFLLPSSWGVLLLSLRHARRMGTLAQY